MSLQAFVHTLKYEAQGIISVELHPQPGCNFPAFTPGSHIDLHLPELGLSRSYSLCNDCRDTQRYVVAVLHEPKSRGGSRYVHEQLRVGMKLTISEPRNHFGLDEQARHSVLVAGGVGITPILSMARRLHALGHSFEVLYMARSRQSAAFVAELQALGMPLHLHFDDEQGKAPDLHALLSRRAAHEQEHYYACGPAPMLDAFVQTCEKLGHTHAHIERFAAQVPAPSQTARQSYTVHLQRSQKTLTVDAGTSLLNTLLAAGFDIAHSCCEGVCGSCETRVLEGDIDHRDGLLSPQEKASNKVMMVCVSGCKSERLVLDL